MPQQHFLLSAEARSLDLGRVLRMTDDQALATFRRLRWPETHGRPVCPQCQCTTCWECAPRPRATPCPRDPGRLRAPRYRCKACRCDFSATSGTLFHAHKLPIRDYLAAIALFLNGVKGVPACQVSRDLNVQYKTAFVLAHKIREAMAEEQRGTIVGGPGEVVEVDGAWFGGHVRPENRAEDRVDRRLAANQNGKRRCVVVVRERGGEAVAMDFRNEDEAVAFVQRRVERGTEIHADEAPAWNDLHAWFAAKRVVHEREYLGDDGACTNQAESFFARARRAEIGQYHHIAGPYLRRYAQEVAFRENHRRRSNGWQFDRLVGASGRMRPSPDFCGYWQRAKTPLVRQT